MATPPTPPTANDPNEAEAITVRISLEARGWRIIEIRQTTSHVVLIAERELRAPELTLQQLRDRG